LFCFVLFCFVLFCFVLFCFVLFVSSSQALLASIKRMETGSVSLFGFIM
jgi:hypothetical protein